MGQVKNDGDYFTNGMGQVKNDGGYFTNGRCNFCDEKSHAYWNEHDTTLEVCHDCAVRIRRASACVRFRVSGQDTARIDRLGRFRLKTGKNGQIFGG